MVLTSTDKEPLKQGLRCSSKGRKQVKLQGQTVRSLSDRVGTAGWDAFCLKGTAVSHLQKSVAIQEFGPTSSDHRIFSQETQVWVNIKI